MLTFSLPLSHYNEFKESVSMLVNFMVNESIGKNKGKLDISLAVTPFQLRVNVGGTFLCICMIDKQR